MSNESGTQLQDVPSAREYQLEMFEESMQRNVIVAQETGSGKTLIAILRMQAELERCSSEKRVWFCVPTVELAFQQYSTISTYLPAFHARVLSGVEHVELWTEQWIWDNILESIRIVVSTHQVLLDALSHGFVKISQLALMIFDEAHSCIGNHPSSRILRDFYHRAAIQDRPSILGLTASPIANRKVGNLALLEANLNAIARTPRFHRAQMLQFVHQPELVKLEYHLTGEGSMRSNVLESLRDVYSHLNMERDPWIMKMRSDPDGNHSKAIAKALLNHKTYCHDQVKVLYERALLLDTELGSSAADYFISRCIQRFQCNAAEGPFILNGLEDMERTYLMEQFDNVEILNQVPDILRKKPHLTPKVWCLINFLKQHESQKLTILVFVRTRAEVGVLSHILSHHLKSLAVSTFVGASSFSGRKNIVGELVEVKNQKDTLDHLRSGETNIVITTNALEEGIDVSACNLVVCFEKPPNLKSFIQRRGRARATSSKYVIMLNLGDPKRGSLENWIELEKEMRSLYQDQMRHLREIQILENQEELGQRELRIDSTGARMTLDDAVQHLYHFCATLPVSPFVDSRPIFGFQEYNHGDGSKTISAQVHLPNSVDSSVRKATGRSQWKTEKMARKDAAFEAYVALYHAGLVNDNLLPLIQVDTAEDKAYAAVEKRPSLIEVSDQINIWSLIAQDWRAATEARGYPISIDHHGKVVVEMLIIIPKSLWIPPEFQLFWDSSTTFAARIRPNAVEFPLNEMSAAARVTSLLLQSVARGKSSHVRDDYAVLFVPSQITSIESWLEGSSGKICGYELEQKNLSGDVGIVRDLRQRDIPYVFRRMYHNNTPNASPDSQASSGFDSTVNHEQGRNSNVTLEVTRLLRRTDFLHNLPGQVAKGTKHSRPQILDGQQCIVDTLPFQFSQFALLIPSILHKIEVALVVDHLCEAILSPLHICDRSLVATSITAPSSALGDTDYQRHEFLGDSLLKTFTSLTLISRHLNYHEGILSHEKDHIVSNGTLAFAAIRKGLDPFVLTKAFTGRKWRPPYDCDLARDRPPKTRRLSTKILADVVEALIGASFLDGGSEKVLTCLGIFLPNVPWCSIPQAIEMLNKNYDQLVPPSPQMVQIEELISYSFAQKSLLVESITHPSHHEPNGSASYERLEFLGDACLDRVVTHAIFHHKPPISVHHMHLVRSSLVNANFLGFLCLKLSKSWLRIDAVVDYSFNVSTVEVPCSLCLWQVMRHASAAVRSAQQTCLVRYNQSHDEISDALMYKTFYPWVALARLEPPKFMSDVVESLLGAIYIDSHGSMVACETFLEHLGLMPYLRRALTEGIVPLHPKEELGQLSDQAKVKYVLGKNIEEGKERLTCTAFVGERQVASVGDGLSSVEVQTRVADEACKILKREGPQLGKDSAGGAGNEDSAMDEGAAAQEQQDEANTSESDSDSDVYLSAHE